MSLVSFSHKFAQISSYQIINYSDSLSANQNNTIQTKQHAMKKPALYSNRNKIKKGLFLWWKDCSASVQRVYQRNQEPVKVASL